MAPDILVMMATVLPLRDRAARDDLRIFLERVLRAGQSDVRLVVRASTLAVFGCTQAPRGITDAVPVVLVTRGFPLSTDSARDLDATVAGRALLDRIARLGTEDVGLEVPEVTTMAAWAGVLPPRSGWRSAGSIEARSLATVAAEGIQRVSSLLPNDPGEAVVHSVRSSVWGLEIAPGVPAAAAFAAETMGFLGDDALMRVTRTQTWMRLSSSSGSVLVRTLHG